MAAQGSHAFQRFGPWGSLPSDARIETLPLSENFLREISLGNFLRERPGPPPLAGPVSRASPGMQEFLSPPHHLLNTNKNNEW